MKTAPILLVLLTACRPDGDTVCANSDEVGLECEAPPDVDEETPVDCQIIGCLVDEPTTHATCLFALWLPVESVGEIGVRLPGAGELGWNELPWNLEGGEFEPPNLAGPGLTCGTFELDLTSEWQGSIELSCTRYGAGGGTVIDAWNQ
jgi:hypothetical protein